MTALEKENCRLAEENVQLRKRVHLLEDAVENVRHGLCLFDSEGRVALCNQRYPEIIGLPKDKVAPGVSARDLVEMAWDAGYYPPGRTIDEIEAEFFNNLFRDEGSLAKLKRGGRTFVIHPGRTSDGNLVATFEDVTAQLSAENALKESEARLRAMLDAMPDCIKIFDEKGQIAYINPKGLELLEAPDLESLASSEHVPVPPEYMNECIDVHKRVLAGESVVWTYEIVGMKGARRHVEAHAVPFQLPDGGKGHLSITRDITQRKAAEDALRRNEERLRIIQDASGLADFENDCGEVTVCSDRFFEQVGLPVGDNTITIWQWLDLVHPEDRDAVQAQMEKAIANNVKVFDSEYRIVRPDNGQVRWISCRTKMLRDENGTAVRTIGAHRDITHRKIAEEALRRSEQRLRLIQDASGQADFETNPNGISVCSDRLFEQCGLPPPPNRIIEFKQWLEIVHAEDRERLSEEVQKSLGKQDSFASEFRIVRADNGETRWIASRIVVERDEEGRVTNTIGAHSDITERKEAELALRESEQRMRLVQEATGLAEFWAGEDGLACVSDQLIEQLGLPVDTETLPFDELLTYIHPDDRDLVKERVEASLKERSTFDCEFRIIHGRTGEVRWIHSRTKMERDETGRAKRSIGAHLDITDRKRAEEALRDSEERFRLAAEAAGLGVWDYDPLCNTRKWSNRLLEIFGLPQDIEPTLEGAASCVHSEDRERFLSTLNRARDCDPPIKLDDTFRIIRADDEVERWIALTCWKTRNTQSQLERIILTIRDVTDEKTAEERILWSASHDALTRLANRKLFQEELEQKTQKGGNTGNAVGLLLLDLDHFKQINDTLGHDAGDRLLKMFADRLRQVVRPVDVVARLGGDEFAIILSEVEEPNRVGEVAEAIQNRLRDPFVYKGRILDCRVSIGGAVCPRDGGDPAELMKSADMALYSAKNAGRSTTRMYDPTMRDEIESRRNMVSLAREAVNERRIVPHYQPKLDLRTGKVTGFEALLRWHGPDGKIRLPDQLEAAFEDLDVAADLSDRMIEQAIVDMRSWLDQGLDFGHVALNASAADFRREDFAERVLEQLRQAGIPPSMFQLEVTETVFLGRGAGYVQSALSMFSSAGVEIALDDFGTGYASLRHLKQFPVDIIKIDRSFVRDMESDPGDDAIVRAVINLGRSLGISVVAEGIEEHSQMERILRYGCHIGQGFLFWQAQPADAIPSLLQGARSVSAASRRRQNLALVSDGRAAG